MRGLRILPICLLALWVAGCSDEPPPEAQPATTVTVTAVNGPKDAVSAETILACRGLAEDKDLRAFWDLVANTRGPLPPSDEQLSALRAVQNLERPAADPLVDDVVGSTMKAAASGVPRMRAEWVKSGTLDVDRFRNLIAPVVKACQAQEIDMTVPE